VFSTNKIKRYEVAEIFLKVALIINNRTLIKPGYGV
jgi:hypothetical protein